MPNGHIDIEAKKMEIVDDGNEVSFEENVAAGCSVPNRNFEPGKIKVLSFSYRGIPHIVLYSKITWGINIYRLNFKKDKASEIVTLCTWSQTNRPIRYGIPKSLRKSPRKLLWDFFHKRLLYAVADSHREPAQPMKLHLFPVIFDQSINLSPFTESGFGKTSKFML